MDTELDLDLATASRETLLALIAGLKATNAQLQQRVAVLESRLNTRGSPGMPGNKPSSGRQGPRKKTRKQRPHGFARMRMAPTQRVEHTLEVCPDCGTHLVGGWVQRTREVIEIPVVPVQVTEHVFVARVCPVCERRRVPKVALNGVVVGQQRWGVNLVSLMVTLREEARLPLRTIQWYLKTVHQLHLSVGGIVQVIHGAAQHAQLAVAEVLERIRASPVVQADETGWRQEGANGYVWTFSTPTERYFLRRGRDKGVVDEVLDESFAGVLVSDFYAAYNHYPGLKQRCWAHLLRDIHDLKVLYPKDAKLAQWAAAIHKLYAEAKAFVHPEARQRRLAQLRLERKLLARCRPYLDDPLAVQGKLCRRIERFIKELLVFVAEPAVPSDNNAAERSLRHLVTSRKISGGTRSEQGTNSKMALASLFGTWRARGLNPLLACRQLLTSPQV
jgi:transposase